MSIFKKKDKNKPQDQPQPPVTETPTPIPSEDSEEFCTDGWKAIEEAFLKKYPDQTNPLHMASLIKWCLGGNDPLDGISIYDGGDYFHFVTFGLSELYEKECEDLEYSGYGFELTMKLRKEGLEDEDKEIRGICGILQAIARITFTEGDIFEPNEYIYTGQTAGMDAHSKSMLTGFVTKLDEMGEIDTPNGKVQFVQLIGATDAELKSIMEKKFTVVQVQEQIGTELTDYTRGM